MNLYNNPLYMEDVARTAMLPLPWEKLAGKTVLLSGATGLLGSFLVDVLMSRNESGMDCCVYALSRNEKRAKDRFSIWNNKHLRFITYDINKPFFDNSIGKTDFILHLASNTHPLQYSTDPIGTITTNIIGLQNILDFAVAHDAERVAFASSNEIYGENRGDVEFFDEKYCGYIDSNTLRAGYPESKRCGEALCQAYIRQKDLDIVIPRFTRSYGPTMLPSDTKAVSQFIRKAVSGQDIVLKSKGTQYYSFTYMSDAISGLLTVLLRGEKGEAYNIADASSDIMLKDLAAIIADSVKRQVLYEIPEETEKLGYSMATKARLNGNKLKSLGWNPVYTINSGINRTISILKSMSDWPMDHTF